MNRVLLIDDSREDRLLAMRELRRALPVAEIVEVSDAAALAEALASGTFDVVVTDYRLRWTTGLEILEAAKAQDRYRPVIMFTATATQEDAVEAMKRGLDDYVVKSPAHIRRLSIAVTAALQRSMQRRTDEEERRRYVEEQERLRAEAEAASRAKDDFLATLSHELRTPLTSIVGWVRMIRAGTVAAARVDHAMAVIERNAQAMTSLVDELLDMAIIVAGHLELKLAPVDVGATVHAAVEAAAPQAAAKTIRVRLQEGPELLIVQADPARLRQILGNLIANALKFTPADGQVTVRWGRRGDTAEIEVSDSGVGVANDVVARIFERFWQADSSRTRHHGGLGIGLAITKGLVEAHGGTVAVASPGALGGTTFTVRLPR